MPQLARALPVSRTNLDPPDAVWSGVIPVSATSGKTAVPDSTSSGGPVSTSSAGVVPNSTSAGGQISSLRQAVIGLGPGDPKGTGSSFDELDSTIEEFQQDITDWKEMGLVDDDNDPMDTRESVKKRSRGYAAKEVTSGRADEGDLLAPFPMEEKPVEFVRKYLGEEELQTILSLPPEDQQFWLMDYLKRTLLRFSEEQQNVILKAPKEKRFLVMRDLFRRLEAEGTPLGGEQGGSGSA